MKRKMLMHIVRSDCNLSSYLDMFCLLQLPSHTMFEVKERNLNVGNKF